MNLFLGKKYDSSGRFSRNAFFLLTRRRSLRDNTLRYLHRHSLTRHRCHHEKKWFDDGWIELSTATSA